MPKLQTNAQRRYRYERIAKAEGDQCIICKIKRGIRVGPPDKKLIIEHADNNQKNWSWNNIHLTCYSDNKIIEKMSVKDKIALFKRYSDQLEREREREGLPTRTSVFKESIPYEDASGEMQARKIYQKRWDDYVLERITTEGSAPVKDLIRAAAKVSGCSKQTSTNYFEVASSSEGLYAETEDADGAKIVVFRDIIMVKKVKIAKKKLVEPVLKTA